MIVEKREQAATRKRCPRCDQMKPLTDFNVKAHNADGSVRLWQSWCRRCNTEASNAHRRALRHGSVEPVPVHGARLDAAPLRAFLRGLHAPSDELGLQCGVTARTLEKIMRGEQRGVHLAVADQIVTRLGGVFVAIYPEEE